MTTPNDLPEPLLQVRGLSKHYPVVGGGVVRALDDVSLTLRERQTLGVVGESGCGKSTLGRTLMRLLKADGGQVRFAGQDWIAAGAQPTSLQRRRMQMVFQDPFSSLDPKMSVGRIVREPLDIHPQGLSRLQRDERVQTLLQTVGLTSADAGRYPHEFSGGQRQRIAIARALALEPSLLIADEPVSALDVSIQSQILNLLMQLREQRAMAMLFISHDLSVVRHVSDEVAVMYFGRIVERAPTDTMFKAPAHPYTQLLLASIPQRNRGASPAIAPESLDQPGAELPDAARPPPGCAFEARCPRARDECRRTAPTLSLRRVAQGERLAEVACHLYPTATT
jgi:oligopeptide transport system ATP-binding protein